MTLYQPYRASAPYREPRALHPRKLWALLLTILLWPAAGARAQAGGNAAPAAPVKIAVLNVRQAIVATTEGKQASAQLQSQFAAQQSDIQNMQKQIQDLQSRLSNGARTLSDDEQGRLQRQGELLARQFQRKQDDLNEAVNAAQSDIIDNIGRKMLDVLDRHARESGYTIVLDTSAQGSPVVYGSSQIDITQEVIRLYDQAYPVKTTAAPSSSPAAPAAQSKPAGPPAGGTPPPAAPKKTP
jgi:outer membrane protein